MKKSAPRLVLVKRYIEGLLKKKKKKMMMMMMMMMKTFGEKISAEACSGKEIAGLLNKKKMTTTTTTTTTILAWQTGGRYERARHNYV